MGDSGRRSCESEVADRRERRRIRGLRGRPCQARRRPWFSDRWSPDDRRLAFSGSGDRLYVADIDARTIRVNSDRTSRSSSARIPPGSGRTARLSMHDQRRAAPLRHECGLSGRADAADVGRNRVCVHGPSWSHDGEVDRLPGRRHDRSPSLAAAVGTLPPSTSSPGKEKNPHARLCGTRHPAGLEPGRSACAVPNGKRSGRRTVRRNGPAITRADVVRIDRVRRPMAHRRPAYPT